MDSFLTRHLDSFLTRHLEAWLETQFVYQDEADEARELILRFVETDSTVTEYLSWPMIHKLADRQATLSK